MTGRYQTRFGHEFNLGGGGGADSAEIGLPLTETTFAQRLKKGGYATGLVGKWHLGSPAKFQPLQRGFDEFFGFLDGAHPYFPGEGAPILRGTEVVEEREYLTDAFLTVVIKDAKDIASITHVGRYIPTELRTAFIVAGLECCNEDCNNRVYLEMDHDHDHALGGPTNFDNLGPLCYPCHVKKNKGFILGPRQANGKRSLTPPTERKPAA